MSTQTLAALALASLIWMAAPGPGVFAVVARSMAFGARSTLPFVAGIVLGDLIYVCFAVFGLALVANLLKDLFVVLHWAAAAYLIFLGIKAWRAPIRGIEQVAKPTGHGAHAFVGGLFLTLGNPKVVIFYLSALPAFVDLPNLALPDGIAMTATMLGVLVLVLTAYAYMASEARRFFRTERAMKMLNRGAGTVMIGAGVAVALKD